MRVLVCGSEYFADRRKVWTNLYELDHYYGFSTLLFGDLRGATKLAKEWADHRGLTHRAFPADRQHFGAAGDIFRNRELVVEQQPDLVIAFCVTELAESTAVKDMVNQALWAKIPLIVIEGDTQWHLTK